MDNSWDNSAKQNWKSNTFNWTNIAIGIAVLLLVMGVFALGVRWVVNNQSNIQSWAQEKAKPDWAEARRIAAMVQTDAGAIAVYRGNPKLMKKFNTEELFLRSITKWRSKLASLPEATPTFESKRFGHAIGIGTASATISYKLDSGGWVHFSWNTSSDNPSRQLIDLAVD
jgi:hypothetical protein